MLTIGQLAKHARVTTKAIRVYHAKGLLAEPLRDGAGYRRYDAQAVIDLARITTLAKAGVPLADIPRVLGSDGEQGDDERRQRLAHVMAGLDERIRDLLSS